MIAQLTSAKALKEERVEVAQEMRKLIDSAEGESRGFSTEEQEKWDGYKEKIDSIDSRIKHREDLDQIEAQRFADADIDEKRQHEELEETHGKRFEKDDPDRPLTNFEKNQAFRYFFAGRHGYRGKKDDLKAYKRARFNALDTDADDDLSGLDIDQAVEFRFHRGYSESGEEFGAPKTSREVIEQAKARREKRTQTVGTASEGGHTVPDEMMQPLEQALLWFGGMRQVAGIIQTDTGAKLPWPTVNDTTNVGEIIGEDSAVNSQDTVFSEVEFVDYKFSSKMMATSVELLQDSATNMPALIGDLAGTRIGRYANQVFTTGTGTAEPRGIVTDAVDSTVTTASNTEITYDEMLLLQHSVDPAYRRQGAQWMFHDTILRILKSIKSTSDGIPLWLPSIAVGEPDTMLGSTYEINNDMATGASAKAVIYGALNSYKIRDIRSFTLLRLDERYAEFHRIAWIAFMRMDGRMVNAGTNPVKYLTLSA